VTSCRSKKVQKTKVMVAEKRENAEEPGEKGVPKAAELHGKRAESA